MSECSLNQALDTDFLMGSLVAQELLAVLSAEALSMSKHTHGLMLGLGLVLIPRS